jgi:hypothetical protein
LPTGELLSSSYLALGSSLAAPSSCNRCASRVSSTSPRCCPSSRHGSATASPIRSRSACRVRSIRASRTCCCSWAAWRSAVGRTSLAAPRCGRCARRSQSPAPPLRPQAAPERRAHQLLLLPLPRRPLPPSTCPLRRHVCPLRTHRQRRRHLSRGRQSRLRSSRVSTRRQRRTRRCRRCCTRRRRARRRRSSCTISASGSAA